MPFHPDDRPFDDFSRSQPVQPGDRLTLTVEKLGENGDGLCRVNNYIIWVPGALPGESVAVVITSANRKNGRATIESIEEASPHRVEPRCAHFGDCGGCQLQHLSYEEQLAFKTELVRGPLAFAFEQEGFAIRPCVGPEDPWGSRARIALQLTERHGQLRGGLYRRRSRDLIEIEECPVSDPNGWAVARAAVENCRSVGIEAWDDRTDSGSMRSILVRTASNGESELTYITRRAHDKEIADLLEYETGATRVALNVHPGDRERLLGRDTRHLAGARNLETEIGGLKFAFTSATWLRSTPFGTNKIVEVVRELLEPIASAKVADLYSGSGLLGLSIARDVAEVFGIEEFPAAVADAVATAKANGITNARYREGKVEQHLPMLRDQHLYAAIMDPPIDGCGRFVINQLAKVVRPEKLIYVSQNPKAFAQEAVWLEDRGYRLTAVQPIDPAPHTGAVDLVARFESSLQGGKRRSTISQARRMLEKVRQADREKASQLEAQPETQPDTQPDTQPENAPGKLPRASPEPPPDAPESRAARESEGGSSRAGREPRT